MKEQARELLVRGLAELGVRLTSDELEKFRLLAAELQKWGRKINLTAIRGDADIAAKHFLDSLTLLKVIGGKGRLLDIGSGAGFPSLPLKIVRHELEVTSVDAVGKKIIFQRHMARLLGLRGFEALHARAEELITKEVGSFDWVVSRAFSDIPTFVGMAFSLLNEHGKIIAMKGGKGREEAKFASAALSDMGAWVSNVIEFSLPISCDARSLIIIEQIRRQGSCG
ncbi:MAG: 16S rRNA (guanine(527)-N(7))-methyltransferase RsmG [Geobacteraceae bacterium]